MIVSFSGIDGSGKTTQAQYVTKLLEQDGFAVHHVQMIRWTLVNRLGRLARFGKTQRTRGSQPRDSGRVLTLMRQLISLLDVLLFRVLYAYQTSIRHRVVVCDRFFYDLGVHALYTGVMGAGFESLYWRVVPSPTVSILLDIPAEVAHQREGKHDLAYYQAKRDLYLKRAPLWRAVVVSAIEREDTQQTVAQILRSYLRKE